MKRLTKDQMETIEQTDKNFKAFYCNLAIKHLNWLDIEMLYKTKPKIRAVLSDSLLKLMDQHFEEMSKL